MGERHYLAFVAKVIGQPLTFSKEHGILPALCDVSPGKPFGAYYQAAGV
jgi:hypothetical protein